ncbi:chemotaxis protein CheW [Rhodopila sp.]|uniref:hybrid sensor histidine kinase/response regulator n=1 Tax=Rhodopila sp. TaxID=2480087 RepID=UPI002CB1686D|nr:chemotaxis protein CheW [Rhodopila sp.]HVZ09041.1 chemotaxis protein CheW [Rhodopila sp.]
MDELLADFLTETNESLAELDSALVKLEQAPDDAQTLGLIFRLVHTIKGTCGFLGLPRLEKVAHAGENVLGRLRDRTLAVTPDIVTQVLAAIDRIKVIVIQLGETGTEPVGDDASLIAALDAVAAGDGPVPAAAIETTPIEITPTETISAETAPVETAPTDAAPVDTAPTGNGLPDAPRGSFADEPPAPQAPVASAMPAEAPNAAGGQQPVAAQTIRVTVDVLEDLMTLVGELVLTRNQLLQLARTQENSAFTAPLQRLSHITSDLQEGVMKTRMQPIGNAWNKLPRLVRDLSHDMGKRIELTMLGADTDLDRQILELIRDPLTHMIRNSADHGLETPAERKAAGKPEAGRIVLNAFHEGGHIVLEMSDDGRGLNVDRIRAKALASSLASEAELAGMSDEQIHRFIFKPGFSTAATVSAVSGRGVGMDVVKTNIEKIGGTVDVESTPGKGTKFTVKIPLTLAIVSALIVEARGERFAIPQISVVELVRARLNADDANANPGEPLIERINDTPVLRLRSQLLPLVSLADLLELGTNAPADGVADVIVAQVGTQMMGVIVDRVFDTEEIVVKPVAPILRHITMFSGNTILGDGSVIMILDPNGIARRIGVGSAGGGESRLGHPQRVDARSSAEKTTMLLFHADGGQRMAVPLGLVARLEDIPRERIEWSCGAPVTQYRGRLMPLVALGQAPDAGRPTQPLLVFADGDRSMGLMVEEITDVVEERLDIELSHPRPGTMGTAVIAGKATDILDTNYWLAQAGQDWTRDTRPPAARRHVLMVDDSDFFRHLMAPRLNAAGIDVTSVGSAAEALRLRDGGMRFDAIVSDLEMPGIDGLQFARTLRAGGAWADRPLIALTALDGPQHRAAVREAGFTGHVAKNDQDGLIASLRACLNEPAATPG